MKDIYFFFDDSGVLHRNEASGCFVYAGYVFLSREDLEAARRKYIAANRQIKRATGRTDELKAHGLEAKHKRALFNSVREYDSVSLAVDINSVYPHILNDKKSICRYKDYVLKICIKRTLQNYIANGKLSAADDVFLHINIDEQLTATNGYYTLKDSIIEELRYGIVNFNYGITHPNVFAGEVQVELRYCTSKSNYMIQASDILANRIWTSYTRRKDNMRVFSNHTHLTFP